ncbi:hypothetical protein [Flavobacterium sp. PL002]|uniref:hypothetical protein n=1 Tax=Flavobacterium sp. PL002 TaxID=1897058 RepID=UPI001CE48AD3|nr:hypothetical protein [Flavobacterium sp. PL002]
MSVTISTKVNTAGGTLLSLVPHLHSEDVLKTVVLAFVGAVVSFTVSLLLKIIMKKRKP